jgi:hypothetical protein
VPLVKQLEGGVMDAVHVAPPNLAARLRGAKVCERVASLLAAATAEELGVDRLQDLDATAGRRLMEIVEAAAAATGTSAVNKLVLEVLARLDEAPDLRDELARLQPELRLH